MALSVFSVGWWLRTVLSDTAILMPELEAPSQLLPPSIFKAPFPRICWALDRGVSGGRGETGADRCLLRLGRGKVNFDDRPMAVMIDKSRSNVE